MKIVCTGEELVRLIRNCEGNQIEDNCRGCAFWTFCDGHNIEDVAEIEIVQGDANVG